MPRVSPRNLLLPQNFPRRGVESVKAPAGEVVADLEGQVRRILNYCDLDWEESCLRFNETHRSVKSASSEQVRQPIYSSAINTWRHYEPHLSALINVLEPLLAKLPECDRPASMLSAT